MCDRFKISCLLYRFQNTGKMCFLHSMKELCNLSEVFMEKSYIVDLITRMVSMAIVWRECGERYL